MVKKMRNSIMISGVLYIIAGLVLLLFPEVTAKTIAYVVAAALVVMGLLMLIMYFKEDASLTGGGTNLITGLLLLMFGIFVFVKVELIISIIPFVLGIFILISGLDTLNQAVCLLRLKLTGWQLPLIFSIVNIVLAVLVIFNPFDTAKLLIMIIGIGLVYSGVTDIIMTMYISGKVRKAQKAINDEE